MYNDEITIPDRFGNPVKAGDICYRAVYSCLVEAEVVRVTPNGLYLKRKIKKWDKINNQYSLKDLPLRLNKNVVKDSIIGPLSLSINKN